MLHEILARHDALSTGKESIPDLEVSTPLRCDALQVGAKGSTKSEYEGIQQ
jgi:hypothetical protein